MNLSPKLAFFICTTLHFSSYHFTTLLDAILICKLNMNSKLNLYLIHVELLTCVIAVVCVNKLLQWGPWKIGFWEIWKVPCRRAYRLFERYAGTLWTGLLLFGGPVGNLEGARLPGLLRENKVYLDSFLDPEIIKILSPSEGPASLEHIHLGPFFLDPEDIRRLSIGAMWNCSRYRAPLI
jgi:hypothetical protein